MPITLPLDQNDGALLLARVHAFGDAPHEVIAQIDTGASDSAIDEQLAIQLKLAHVVNGIIRGAAFADRPTRGYDAIVGLPMGAGKWMGFGRTLASFDLSDQKPKLIIGRDILKECSLTYHGKRGTFTLTICLSPKDSFQSNRG